MRNREALHRTKRGGRNRCCIAVQHLFLTNNQNATLTMAELSMTESAPNALEEINTAHALATKLNALLAMTYGDQGESFRCMSDCIQDEYMWACSDMAEELKKLVIKLL